MDEQKLPAAPADSGQRPGSGLRGPAFQAAALGLTLISLLTCGFFMMHWLKPDQPAGNDPTADLFKHWPRDRQPDLVLILTGQQYGYLNPCGCSRPQLGGLPRRYNFIEALKKYRGWNVVAVDVGDIAQKSGPQLNLKYEYSMKALRDIGYTAVGVGPNEIDMPLMAALPQFALNNPKPAIICENIEDKPNLIPFGLGGDPVVTQTNPKVGILAAVGPTVEKTVRNAKFSKLPDMLPNAIKKLSANKAELVVLLYQGTNTEAQNCAAFCQKEKLPLNVILCPSDQAEPPQNPINDNGTLIVNVGHKGRYVGVIGVYRNDDPKKPFDLYYQLAPMGEEYEPTAKNAATNPALQLLEQYAQAVKSVDFLSSYPKSKHPIQLDPAYANAEYVGSRKCKSCHKEAYKVWEQTPHSHAYETLVKAERPSLAQFDGECIECHVVGFKHTTGFVNDVKTPDLKDVGCENCHGPGSEHVKLKNAGGVDPKLSMLMNPWRSPRAGLDDPESAKEKEKRELKIDLFCQGCHDIDNDVHWKFEKWQKIIHHEPGLELLPRQKMKTNGNNNN